MKIISIPAQESRPKNPTAPASHIVFHLPPPAAASMYLLLGALSSFFLSSQRHRLPTRRPGRRTSPGVPNSLSPYFISSMQWVPNRTSNTPFSDFNANPARRQCRNSQPPDIPAESLTPPLPPPMVSCISAHRPLNCLSWLRNPHAQVPELHTFPVMESEDTWHGRIWVNPESC